MMNTGTLRIAIAQMEIAAGSPQRNLDNALSFIAQAAREHAQLVILPGYCLSGFPLAQDGRNECFLEELRHCEQELVAASDAIALAFGSYDPALPHPGTCPDCLDHQSITRIAYNGAMLQPANDGSVLISLGTSEYALFPDIPSAMVAHNAECAAESESPNTARVCLRSGYLPWRVDRDPLDSSESAACGVLDLSCNAVGIVDMGSGVLSLSGASSATLHTNDAKQHVECSIRFEEDLEIIDVDFDTSQMIPHRELRDTVHTSRDELLLDALVTSIRRFDDQVFNKSVAWIIGLSGGLDSSMTAALLALALEDKTRIHAYSLSSRYNSDTTKSNACILAETLGISLLHGSIEDLVAATKHTALSYGYQEDSLSGLVEENIQARLRGHMLSTFAAIEGGVIVNNGNKLECALGYATLYGDAIGALAPLADLTKVRMFGLAKAINARLGKTVIPQNLLPIVTEDGYDWETMPSAELKDAQKDPMKWFYHDWLVERLLEDQGNPLPVMQDYLRNAFADTSMDKWVRFYGLDKPSRFIEDLEWVLRQIRGSAFKRFQSPPGLVFTQSSFALGYPENQVRYELGREYETLRARILAKA